MRRGTTPTITLESEFDFTGWYLYVTIVNGVKSITFENDVLTIKRENGKSKVSFTLTPMEKHFTGTVSDFLTVPSGVTVAGSCTTYGEMVELYLNVKPSSAQNAKWLCGTLKHDYIPIDYSYSVEWGTGAAVEAGTDGRIRMNSAVTTNTSCYMSFVFVKKY